MLYNSLNINNCKINYSNIILINKKLSPLFFALLVHLLIFIALFDNYQQPIVVNLHKMKLNFAGISTNNSTKIKNNNSIKESVSLQKATQPYSGEVANNFKDNASNNSNISSQKSIAKSTESNQGANISSDPVFDAQYLNNPSPIYPISARNNNIQGKVYLSVLVGVEGRAMEVKIANSSGYAILDNAALSTVSKWQFIPAKKNGELTLATVIVPIEFKII